MASAERPATMGRGQQHQTLPPAGVNDKNREEEYPDSEAYNDKEDEGADDARILTEAHTPDLRATRDSIQELASTVSFL